MHSESGQAERRNTTMSKEKKIHYKEIDNHLEKIKIEVFEASVYSKLRDLS